MTNPKAISQLQDGSDQHQAEDSRMRTIDEIRNCMADFAMQIYMAPLKLEALQHRYLQKDLICVSTIVEERVMVFPTIPLNSSGDARPETPALSSVCHSAMLR